MSRSRMTRLGYRRGGRSADSGGAWRSGDQVLDEPVAGGSGGDLKAASDVGVEVATRHQDELLGLRRCLVRCGRELAGDEPVVGGDYHEQRGGRDALDVLARLIALEHLERT